VAESSCTFAYVEAREGTRIEKAPFMVCRTGNGEGGTEQVPMELILRWKAPRAQRIACFFAEGRKKRPFWVTLERGL
jgi:hypothetical protein